MLSIGSDLNESTVNESTKFGSSFTYDLLADESKSQIFSYVHCSQPQRSKYAVARTPEQTLESLDKVRIALDFAYLDETEAR